MISGTKCGIKLNQISHNNLNFVLGISNNFRKVLIIALNVLMTMN